MTSWRSDFDQCLNPLQHDLITLLVNFSCEFEQIMTIYDFLEAKGMKEILFQCVIRYDFLEARQLHIIARLVNFSYDMWKMMTMQLVFAYFSEVAGKMALGF